jgi:dolichol-phosphate mannosyltransferase
MRDRPMSVRLPSPPSMQRSHSLPYSVVVPFYNEQDNVATLISEIEQAMTARPDYEIVTVNDGSTDGTRGQLAAAGAGFGGRLLVVEHESNRGQSAAICSGVDAAAGEWVITLDGDGQNDPADIPALLALIENPGPSGAPDLICGNRRVRRDTRLRRVSSSVANAVRRRLLDDATPDTGCGLKVFRRDVFLALPRFNHMHRFLPALIQRDGGVTISVTVSHRPRVRGLSSYGVWDRLGAGIVDLIGVLWLKRRALKGRSRNHSHSEETIP